MRLPVRLLIAVIVTALFAVTLYFVFLRGGAPTTGDASVSATRWSTGEAALR